MRGKACDELMTDRDRRITPAYAGKRRRIIMDARMIRDHPRVCGEKAFMPRVKCHLPGSPPRMRGKARATGVGIKLSRITPAYAGKRLKLM